MQVNELLKQLLYAEGEPSDEAGMVLSLLVERAITVINNQKFNNDIDHMLGPEYAGIVLTNDEIKYIANELIEYINNNKNPNVSALTILTKCKVENAVPVYIDVLNKFLPDASKEDLVYQALCGIQYHGLDTIYTNESIEAIRKAAQDGQGWVLKEATRLELLLDDTLKGLTGIFHKSTNICSHAIINRETNTVSLIEVFEQLNINRGVSFTGNKNQPQTIDFDVVTSWHKIDVKSSVIGTGRLMIESPSGKILYEKEYIINLLEDEYCNIIVGVQNFIIEEDGEYCFDICIKSKNGSEWLNSYSFSLTVFINN